MYVNWKITHLKVSELWLWFKYDRLRVIFINAVKFDDTRKSFEAVRAAADKYFYMDARARFLQKDRNSCNFWSMASVLYDNH